MEAFAQEMRDSREHLRCERETLRAEQERLEVDQTTLSQQRLLLQFAQQDLEEEQQQLRRDATRMKKLTELQVAVEALTEKFLQIKQDPKAQGELKEVEKMVVQLKGKLQSQNKTIETLGERIKVLEKKQEKKQEHGATPVETREEQEKEAVPFAPVEAEQQKQEKLRQHTELICSMEDATSGEEYQEASEKPKKPTAWKKIIKAFTGGSKKNNEKKEQNKRRAMKLPMEGNPRVVEAREEEITPQQNECCSTPENSQRPSAWSKCVQFLAKKTKREKE